MTLSHFFFSQVYVGSISKPEVKDKVENAKLIITIGSVLSDLNTGNFTYHIPRSKTIEVLESDAQMCDSVELTVSFSFNLIIPGS